MIMLISLAIYNRENNQARKEGNKKVEPNKRIRVTCASKGNSTTKKKKEEGIV